MAIIGVRESPRVVGWAVTRVNAARATKHEYEIAPVPHRPYVAVSASPEALDALLADLQLVCGADFKVDLRPYEVTAAGF